MPTGGLRPYILGIDPGLSGALALYHPGTGTLLTTVDMPLTKVKDKNIIDLPALSLFFKEHHNFIRGCVIEDVAGAPRQGVVSVFTFGYSAGIVTGMTAAHDIPIVRVKPAVWKSLVGLQGKDKDASRELAIARFKGSKELFSRKKDDGRAEAALLAEYGARIFP